MPSVFIKEGQHKWPFHGNLTSAVYGDFDEYGQPKGDCNSVEIGAADEIDVTNDAMGGDPLPGVPKKLKLTFEGEATCVIPEGAQVEEQTGEIKAAVYGEGTVWMACNPNDEGTFGVTNGELGGDPCPGIPKHLVIIYQ